MKGVSLMILSNLYQLYRKRYYVYEHYIDGNLFYIGKGQGGRAVEFWSRNDYWKRLVNGRYGDIEVRIVKVFEDESEAILLESKLLKLNIDNKHLTNQQFANYHRSQYEKQTKEFIFNRIVEVIPEYLDRVLINADKTQLCEEINLIDINGRVIMWPTIKKLLIENGFIVNEKTKTINGKRSRIVIIHDSHNLIDKSNIKPIINKIEKLLDEEKTLKSQISDNEKGLELLLDEISDLTEETFSLRVRKEKIYEEIEKLKSDNNYKNNFLS